MKKLFLALVLFLALTLPFAGTCLAGQDFTATLSQPLSFTFTDFYGNEVSFSDFSGASLVMINIWEPWCGPCQSELSDLARLYETYKDQGFVLLGLYEESTMDDTILSLIEENGITYPLIRYEYGTSSLDELQSGYVPTTAFLYGDGTLATSELFVGSNSYEGWEEIVTSLLNGTYEEPVSSGYEYSSSLSSPLSFALSEFSGGTVSFSDFPDASLILINIWEPWCSPCISELADLARLYETYKDRGLVILGCYSETGMDDDISSLITENSITYPLLRYTTELNDLQSGYVPTTALLLADGTLATPELFVGSRSYEQWEEIILPYLP